MHHLGNLKSASAHIQVRILEHCQIQAIQEGDVEDVYVAELPVNDGDSVPDVVDDPVDDPVRFATME